MTELQLSGAQMMIDALTIVTPAILVFVVGRQLIRMALGFLTGRGYK